MDFNLPPEITAKLAELDAFIEREIKPLEREHMQTGHRYRITEGTEEVQIGRLAQYLFGFGGKKANSGV